VFDNVKKKQIIHFTSEQTLRWLAGGSYLDICFAFGISQGTFLNDKCVLRGTIAAIDKVLQIGFTLNDAN